MKAIKITGAHGVKKKKHATLADKGLIYRMPLNTR